MVKSFSSLLWFYLSWEDVFQIVCLWLFPTIVPESPSPFLNLEASCLSFLLIVLEFHIFLRWREESILIGFYLHIKFSQNDCETAASFQCLWTPVSNTGLLRLHGVHDCYSLGSRFSPTVFHVSARELCLLCLLLQNFRIPWHQAPQSFQCCAFLSQRSFQLLYRTILIFLSTISLKVIWSCIL